jgi:hypothetical protein
LAIPTNPYYGQNTITVTSSHPPTATIRSAARCITPDNDWIDKATYLSKVTDPDLPMCREN